MALLDSLLHQATTNGNWSLVDSEVVGSGGSGGAVTLDLSGSTQPRVKILAKWRSDVANTQDDVEITLNGDTGTNYTINACGLSQSGDFGSVPSTGNSAFELTNGSVGANSPASHFTVARILLNMDADANTDIDCNVHSTFSGSAHRRLTFQGVWANTARPTSIAFAVSNGTEFVEFSTFYAYELITP